MTAYLLDTSIVSAILRKDAKVEGRVRQAVLAKDHVWLSAVVFYESKRSLLKRDAKKQMQSLEQLVGRFEWCDMLREDWELAAQLWAERVQAGKPIGDADLLIAVQAKRIGAVLVTDNEKDFDGLGVVIENWRGSQRAK